MKKIRVLTLAVLTLAALLLALSSCQDYSSDGDESPESFEVSSSSDVFVLDGTPIQLSAGGEAIKDPDGVSFRLVGGTKDLANLTDGGLLSFGGVGWVEVRAFYGELASANTVTVAATLPDSTISENISAALSVAPSLGDKLNIGINEKAAHVYSLEGLEGFAFINSEGLLEFNGIRAVPARLRLLRSGELVYEGMYSQESSPLSARVLSSLADDGFIPNVYCDASAELIASVTSLDLSGLVPRGREDYSALGYFASLEELDLSRAPLYDLSFLSGLSRLKTLRLDGCSELENNDSGLTLNKTLDGLSALESLSMKGSMSCLDRRTFNMIVGMVSRGRFKVSFIEGAELDGQTILGFSETVFFSYAELNAHLEKNRNVLTPDGMSSHAVIVLSREETDLSDYRPVIDTQNLTTLELYGREGYSYGMTFEGSTKPLSVNMYCYKMNAQDAYGRVAIKATGALHISACRGSCYVWGGKGASGISSANAVTVSGDVYLSALGGATLEIWGGRGADGANGVANGSNPYPSNPDNVDTSKYGGSGSSGAYGVFGVKITFLSRGISVYGGNGGNGGRGGDGVGENIFSGGYDAGPGGNGGDGAQALFCKEYVNEFSENRIVGGSGGSGGAGGNGYAAGIDGTPGNPGIYTGEVKYY